MCSEKIFPVFLGLTCFLIISCNNETNQFTIGQDFIESATNLAVVDTFQVEMSTVIQDSLVTSEKGVMLIGKYTDTLFGDVYCNSYFRITKPDQMAISEKEIYDSISLILFYSGYSYGDTNNLFEFSVHQLYDSIKLRSTNHLYNTTSFRYIPEALGQLKFWPTPSRTDSLEIKIDTAFGRTLFNKFRDESEDVRTEDNFINYIRGLVIIGNKPGNNAIIGLKGKAGRAKIRMYTHQTGQQEIKSIYDFPLTQERYQFNEMHYDFTQSPLFHTGDERTTIPSGQTWNETFVQGYLKIMTKVQFPTLPDLLLNERGIILKAQLELRPEKSSYLDFNLPDFVILYRTDHKNQPAELIQKGTLILDELYHLETVYTFDITDFINDEIADSYYNPESGLLVSLYNENHPLNLERIILEAKNPAPRLKITYLTY